MGELKPLPNIAVLIETSTSWGAGLIRGIAQFAREYGPWLFYLEPHGRYEKLMLPQGWHGDGIIARVNSPQLAEQIAATGLPAVNCSTWRHEAANMAQCTVDEEVGGRLAADHLMELGFRHFAYVSALHRPGYVDRLGEAFERRLATSGRESIRFPPAEDLPWDASRDMLARWLMQLPKPVGVFTWTDVRGRTITEACTYAGLRVPDDVAVLGGEYDELSSAVSNPPLSTIDFPNEVVGRRAAMLLHDRLWGQPFPDEPVYIPPLGVLSRQSTDTLAIEDGALRQAIAVLREHAFEQIHIKQLLDLVPMSRRQFELSCRQVLGRTPAEELRRLRLERAKNLLADTEDPISRIAEQVGFNHAEVLNRSFRTHVGLTPTAFRKQYQRGM